MSRSRVEARASQGADAQRARQPESAHWQNEQLRKCLRRSAVAHLLLFVLLLAKTVGAPKKPIPLQTSVRVDLVGLPDLTKKELWGAAPSATPDLEQLGKKLTETQRRAEALLRAPKEPKPADDALALKKERRRGDDDLRDAIERIKALQAIEESLGKPKSKAAKAPPAKGNVLSQGGSLTGGAGGEYNAYAENMRARLAARWDLPIWLSKIKLSAQVVVFLDATGGVVSTVFAKSSGNRQFDEYVLRTIRDAQPFGAPPREILDNGVTLGFPL